MTSLLLKFNDGRWTLDTTTSVTGLDATAQVALVNIATSRGGDKSAPAAGTNLLLQGTGGLLSNRRAAAHAANWAAAETAEFINNNSPQEQWLQGIWLELETFNPPKIRLNAVIQGPAGETRGYPMTL